MEEIQFGGEAHCAQHAHRVFAIARLGVADHLETTRLDIVDTVDEIPNREILDVVVQAVSPRNRAARHLLRWCRKCCRADPAALIEGTVLGVARGDELRRLVDLRLGALRAAGV